MIRFSHVYKSYDSIKNVLKDINFEIGKGEFVFLTGPSGAGKTTLLRLLSAYDKCSSGSIDVLGHSLTRITSRQIPFFRRKIGVVYQDFKLLRNKTLRENVSLPLKIIKYKDKHIYDRSSKILEAVGLHHKANKYPEQLSGGEQQRVCIARAIIHCPELLIADEPTGNLDPDLSQEIIHIFENLAAQGTAVLIATHDHELVRRKMKRHMRIRDGELEC